MKNKSINNLNLNNNLNYTNMFLLFMVGSVIGSIGEGFFSLFAYGKWEWHVICMWGPFCIIYGLGMVAFYIIGHLLRNQKLTSKAILSFLISSLVCTIIELVSGLILEFGMKMRA